MIPLLRLLEVEGVFDVGRPLRAKIGEYEGRMGMVVNLVGDGLLVGAVDMMR
jgi:hypothetical protein